MRLLAALCTVVLLACGGSSNPAAPSATPAPPAPAPAPAPAPTFQGQWSGTYAVSACTGLAQSAGPPFEILQCSSFPTGRTAPFTLTATQAGTAVSGTFVLNGTQYTSFSSPVNADGSVSITAVPVQPLPGAFNTAIAARLTLGAAGELGGTFTATVTPKPGDGAFGSVTVTNTIATATR